MEQEDPEVQDGSDMTCVTSTHFTIGYCRHVVSDFCPHYFETMQKRTCLFIILASVFELFGVALYLSYEMILRTRSEQATDCYVCIALIVALVVMIGTVPVFRFLRRIAAFWLTFSIGLTANLFFIAEAFLRLYTIDPIGNEALSQFRYFVVVVVAAVVLIALASVFLGLGGISAHFDLSERG